MDFAEKIYQATEGFPRTEQFGLSQQMRRAAVSVVSNIAEGSARKNTGELKQFIYISLASLSELETQLLLSERLKFCEIHSSGILNELHRVRRMLTGLLSSLNRKA